MSDIVELTILGHAYRLQADEDGSDLNAVGMIVNERIEEIRRAAPDLSAERLAILAALNLADDLLRERSATKEAVTAARERIAAIHGRLAGLVEVRD